RLFAKEFANEKGEMTKTNKIGCVAGSGARRGCHGGALGAESADAAGRDRANLAAANLSKSEGRRAWALLQAEWSQPASVRRCRQHPSWRRSATRPTPARRSARSRAPS